MAVGGNDFPAIHLLHVPVQRDTREPGAEDTTGVGVNLRQGGELKPCAVEAQRHPTRPGEQLHHSHAPTTQRQSRTYQGIGLNTVMVWR